MWDSDEESRKMCEVSFPSIRENLDGEVKQTLEPTLLLKAEDYNKLIISSVISTIIIF